MITFDAKQSRFRDDKGRFISEKQIHDHIEKIADTTRQDLRAMAQRFIDGKISLPQFQIEMRDRIKAGHILTASIGKGGRKSMLPADWGKVGADLKTQYGYLNKFARDIQNGAVSDPQLLNRAQSYAKAIRAAYFVNEKQSKEDAGFTECQRVQNSKEGCSECSDWADKGFVPIDEQPDIGSLICGGFCLCILVYR